MFVRRLFHIQQTAWTANLTRQRTEAEDRRRDRAGARAGSAGQCPADTPLPCPDLQLAVFLQACEIHIRSFLKKRMSADGTGLFRTDDFRIGRKEYGVGNAQPEAAGLLLRKKGGVKQPWKQRLIRHSFCVKIRDACFHLTNKRFG